VARSINDEREGKAPVSITSQGNDADFPWNLLGGKPAKIGDAKPKEVASGVKKLFKCEPQADGKLKLTKIAEGTLKKTMLSDDHVFIVDGVDVVFVWVGAKAPGVEKKTSLSLAQTYLTQENRGDHLPVARVFSHHELATFDVHFD